MERRRAGEQEVAGERAKDSEDEEEDEEGRQRE